MKAAVFSKVIWVNLILTILASIELLSASPVVPPQFIPYIALFAGVLNIVLRIWFSDGTTIKGVFKVN